MGEAVRGIRVESYTIRELVDAVERGEFLIPTFQRDVIWRQDQIASLWDSMYRSFPIGSLISWQTSERLDLIREVGGYPISNERMSALTGEYNYILDGQQRLTAIYVAMKDKHGSIQPDPGPNYALYFDPTADLAGMDSLDGAEAGDDQNNIEDNSDEDEDDTEAERDGDNEDDDESDAGGLVSDQAILPEKSRYFLFRKDANRRRAALAAMGLPQDLIAPIAEPKEKRATRIAWLETQPQIPSAVIERLKLLERLLVGYLIPIERVRGVDRAEVCDIFLRINTAGKRANSTDVVIATMFGGRGSGFDLRRMFTEIREAASQRQPGWKQVKSLLLMRMIGICVREVRMRDGAKDANSFGVSSRQLLNLEPELVKPYWDEIRAAIDATIAFLMSEGVYHPTMATKTYLPMPLAAHFLYNQSRAPHDWEADLIAQWVWRAAFDPAAMSEEKHIAQARSSFFAPIRAGRRPSLPGLTISKSKLLGNAQTKSPIYKATLAFLSRQGPRDFDGGMFVTFDPDAPETPVFGRPSIHHIYPLAFLEGQGVGTMSRHRNALMNMCLLSEATNQRIRDRNPVEYFQDYAGESDFLKILDSHLIPERFVMRERFDKGDYALFLDARIKWFVEKLERRLPNVKVKVTA